MNCISQFYPSRPGIVKGLTPGSSYVNPVSIARRPAAGMGAQSHFVQSPASASSAQLQAPVMGAVGGTPTAEETEPKRQWVFDETEVLGNTGNGWQVFPGAEQNSDYNTEPSGILDFDSETVFREPADCPQGHPLA